MYTLHMITIDQKTGNAILMYPVYKYTIGDFVRWQRVINMKVLTMFPLIFETHCPSYQSPQLRLFKRLAWYRSFTDYYCMLYVHFSLYYLTRYSYTSIEGIWDSQDFAIHKIGSAEYLSLNALLCLSFLFFSFSFFRETTCTYSDLCQREIQGVFQTM